MRLGNDIVDIAASSDHNPRFIDRVISPLEKTYFEESLLWHYWAAKEAAYKAVKQTREIPFHHREFIVAPDLRSITFHGESLALAVGDPQSPVVSVKPTFLSDAPQPVIAVVTDGSLAHCHSRVHAYASEPSAEEQSLKARELLIDLGAEILGLPRSELSVVTENRIPRLAHQSRPLPYPTSLTHHGRFVAASLGLMPP